MKFFILLDDVRYVNMMETFPRMLMIGGTARKSGKTTLIGRLLEAFGTKYRIGAAKVALYDDEGDFGRHYPDALPRRALVIREEDAALKKDSDKYLGWGAAESWFMAALPDREPLVLEQIRKISERTDLMILESNTLRKNIQPAVFVMINKPDQPAKRSARELAHLVDYTLETGDNAFEDVHQFIGIRNGRWMINKTNHDTFSNRI